jgi:polysaccharide biosynthesis/export protein
MLIEVRHQYYQELKVQILKALFVSVVLAVSCFGQQESLLIGPGDELSVKVFDTPEMDQRVRVTDAGEIPLLFIGDVHVATFTPAEAARAIEDTLKEKQLMNHPRVAVHVEVYSTQEVSVVGQVRNPGAYSIAAPLPVLKVLSKAGGLTDVADRHITIQRHGDSQRKLDYFLSNSSDTALENGVMVYPGDTVIVPKAGIIYVLGDVGRPGGYTMSDNDSQMTVLEAVANAGGVNKTAIASKVKLVRKTTSGTTEIPISLGAMQKGKRSDIAMQPNDVLFVPFSYMKNIVFNGSQIAAAAVTAVIYSHP